MDISVNGKSLNVGDALKAHVVEELTTTVAKYFSRAHDASVTISRERHQFRVDICVHPLKSMIVNGHANAQDAYAAADSAIERIGKQLRRYKRRLNDHHKRRAAPEESIPAQQYVLAAEAGEDELPEDGQPVIIAELPTEIATLSVREAVMRMDLADAPAVMFRNRSSGGMNVVYRRPDGNIGWIDPSGSSNI